MVYQVAISIGVGKPGGRALAHLPGAVNGAELFAAWAEANGYKTALVTDRDGTPVTADSLSAKIQPLLDEDRIDRIILYFAGHGASLGDEDYWLLTDWNSRGTEAIHVAHLRRYLDAYQPKQIALIGDACRTTGKLFNHLLGNPIVRWPATEWKKAAQVETFKAASLGDPAYMKADPDPQKARCLFTELMLSALNGAETAAVKERDGARVVTSVTLAEFLEEAVSEEGGRLKLTVRPDIQTGFREPADIYATLPPLRRRHVFGAAKAADLTFIPEFEAPAGLVFEAERRLVDDLAQAEADRLKAAFERERALDRRMTHAETGAGVSVIGARVLDLVTSPGSVPLHDQPNPDRSGHWFTLADVGQGQLTTAASVGFDLGGKGWIFGCAYPRGMLTLTVADDGAVTAMMRTSGYQPSGGPDEFTTTEDVLARLVAGLLTSSNALDAAVELREIKHVDPVRGILAAYLYDRVGDIDSIRQIASFYHQAGQAIPFEVALLGRLSGERAPGGYRVTVPATPGREPRTDKEQQRDYLFYRTSEIADAVVGGAFPLMRQGWGLLSTSRLPVDPRLPPLFKGLTHSPFTAMNGPQGRKLADLIQEGAA